MYAISEPLVVEVGPNNKKDPGGLSGIVLIAESHISFHTFPRRGFVTIDIYTCADELDTDQLLKEFKKVFKFTDEDTHYIKRGVRYPQTDTN
jgi:S-adenosylmethionine decarboxylase